MLTSMSLDSLFTRPILVYKVATCVYRVDTLAYTADTAEFIE